jgi:hypothetical protein
MPEVMWRFPLGNGQSGNAATGHLTVPRRGMTCLEVDFALQAELQLAVVGHAVVHSHQGT